MATLSLPHTTGMGAAVARHAERLKECFRWARSRATRKQENEYTRQLAKDVLSSDRRKSIEHVCALVVDIAQRGSLEDAEAIGQSLIAIARSEHAAAHPGKDVELSRAEAHIAEEQAEGDVEICETRMALEPSTTNLIAFLAASARHARARRELDAAVRRDLAKRPA